MKKLLIATLLILCFALPALAGEATIKFGLDPRVVEHPDFKGCVVYMNVDEEGPPWNKWIDVTGNWGSGQTSFGVTHPFNPALGTHTYYAVMTAVVGTEESDYSSAVSDVYTMLFPAPIMYELRFKVE